jgi:hypothetical protein
MSSMFIILTHSMGHGNLMPTGSERLLHEPAVDFIKAADPATGIDGFVK